jgi:hypothetical protein
MAVQAFPYLVMTDGTDTVTFADGAGGVTNYPPVRDRWSPSVAGIRTSQLGGRGPYADVQEDILINIRDTTAALCWSRLDTLARLLDKAERWWLRNEQINPVLLKYVPQGSTIHSNATPMQAIVLGRVGDNQLNGVDLPESVNDAGMLFEIYGIKVLCLRRGGWTGASDNTGASGAAANCTVITQTFGATHPTNSPLDVEIGGFTKVNTPIIKAGYLCVGSQSSDVQVLEAETGTAASYTSVADAAALARGGSVLRFTPAVTTAVTSGTITGLTPIGGSPIAVIAAVRNNGATTYMLHANLSGVVGAVSTPDVLIDASTVQPRLVMLGTVVGSAIANVTLTITASAAASTLDIDYLILVNLRDETVNIIAHDDINLANLATAGAATLDAIFRPTIDRAPQVYAGGTAGTAPGSWRGALPFMTVGTNVYALWVATNGTFWRFTNTANAIVNVTLNVNRYRSYLTPQ